MELQWITGRRYNLAIMDWGNERLGAVDGEIARCDEMGECLGEGGLVFIHVAVVNG